MHQEHAIPWHLPASHLKFIHENPHVTPHLTDLFATDKPSRDVQTKECGHFAKCVGRTLREFSDTERAKHPATFTQFPSTGKLFDDELIDKYPWLLNDNIQRFDYWIARAQASPSNGSPSYGTFDDYLAEVIRVLIYEDKMNTLLMLAHHPQIPIRHLFYLSQAISVGWSTMAEFALQPYIYFNLIVAGGWYQSGVYKQTHSYRRLVESITHGLDYPLRNAPGWTIFDEYAELSQETLDRPDDHERLHEWLKKLFRILYCCDMLQRECRVGEYADDSENGWGREVEINLQQRFHVPIGPYFYG